MIGRIDVDSTLMRRWKFEYGLIIFVVFDLNYFWITRSNEYFYQTIIHYYFRFGQFDSIEDIFDWIEYLVAQQAICISTEGVA